MYAIKRNEEILNLEPLTINHAKEIKKDLEAKGFKNIEIVGYMQQCIWDGVETFTK